MTLEQGFAYLLITASSVSTIFFGMRRLALPFSVLRGALTEFAECVGAAIVFLVINEIAGTIILFSIRGVWGFIPLYELGKPTLIAFSVLQGFLFQMWWRRGYNRKSATSGR